MHPRIEERRAEVALGRDCARLARMEDAMAGLFHFGIAAALPRMSRAELSEPHRLRAVATLFRAACEGRRATDEALGRVASRAPWPGDG